MIKNIILVHGAWADGSSWSSVIPILKAAGCIISATQHPLTSLKEDVEITRRLAEVQDGPVLLVGHSYGGAIITEAAHQCPNIAGLVYVAAFAPDAGENIADLSQHTLPAPGNAAVHPDKYGLLWLDKQKFRESFCQDVAEQQATVLSIVQKPIAITCFSDKITNAGWKQFPCWYQVSDYDRMIAPELQQFMAARMKPRQTLHLPASHTSMISRPDEIAELILTACHQL